MQDLAERLDNIRVHVRAPGAEIEAELSRRTHIVLHFGEGAYAFTDEAMMERALASIANLLWVGWQRQYRRAIEYTDLIVDASDSTDTHFFTERGKIEAVGESSDHRIAISTVGMQDYSIHIEPGTLRGMVETEFIRRFAEAAALLIRDFQAKAGNLRRRIYAADSGLDMLPGDLEANSARPQAEHQQQTAGEEQYEPRSGTFLESAW